MSRKYTYQSYFNVLHEVRQRYEVTRDTSLDFEADIRPFLEANVKVVEDIYERSCDSQFTEATQNKVVRLFSESLMNCHATRMSRKMFEEELKYIYYWLKYIESNEL